MSLRQRVRGSVVARAIRFRPPTRDLSWEHCCYAPCRDDRSLRHPEEHKVPERLRALRLWCVRGICRCKFDVKDAEFIKKFLVSECFSQTTRNDATINCVWKMWLHKNLLKLI